jgi:glycosyltransferase involved in cell wall biosynthesis
MHYYDFELCLALQSVGVQVTLLTCDATRTMSIPPSLQVAFPFRGIFGDDPKLLRGLRYLRGLGEIALAMQRRKVSLAHLHYFHFPPLEYLFLKWLRLAGKHLVFTVHDVIPFDASSKDLVWLRRLYHEADLIIVHAESSRTAMVDEFEVDPDKVRIIPMGPYLGFAERQRLPASTAKQRLGLESDTSVILFFGQIKRVKGLRYLIRAFREVLERCPSTYLIIAGPEWKESFADYANLIRKLDLGHRVQARIEYVPDDEVGTYFSAADVVALPYTEVYQSAVLYMACSFARPVVASAVGGMVEVVTDGLTGLLVPPGDVERLASALLTLLQDPEMAGEMGERGRALVRERFGWARIAQRTAEVYAEALLENRR